MYKDSIAEFSFSDSFLFEEYLIFLVSNDQVINALHSLSAWKPDRYFAHCAKLRSEQRIFKLLLNLNTLNTYENEYDYALAYDGHLMRLIVDIQSILNEKIAFWKEVNQEGPLMVRMQEKGNIIIDQMYALNCFYHKSVKKSERKIYSFDATAIYAMYLLSTTNFKDYAEDIIKGTSKLLEEVDVSQNLVAETFAIRVRL